MILIKIYTLTNPITSKVFYVGKTVKSLDYRLKQHINDKEANASKIAIIKEIKSKNLMPIISLIENHLCENEKQELDALHREGYWIKFYVTHGHDLCSLETSPRLLSNYQKESNKTKVPVGVRFNIKHFEYLKKQENINSTQKVVDFLLAKYYFENNIY